MGELAEAGCVAFSQAEAPLADTQVLLRAMQYAATFGYRVWLRPQDAHLAQGRRRARRRSRDAARPAGDPGGRPRRSRSRRSSRWCATPARACTCAGCRPPTASRWCAPRRRRACRSPATSRVHHLHLCDVDIGWFDAQCRLDAAAAQHARPRRAARRARRRHDRRSCAPTTRRSTTTRKQLPFAEAEPGATGLELLLPLTLKWAAEDKVALPDGAGAHHRAAGGDPRASTPGTSRVGRAGRRLRLRSATRTGRSSRARSRARARTRRSSASKFPGRVR